MLAICKAENPGPLKAPTTLSKDEKKVPIGTKPGAKFGQTKSKVEAEFGFFAPKDSISQTAGNDEGPNKLSLDHIFTGTNPYVLVEKTKSASEGLETFLTKPITRKGASTIEKEIKEEFNTSSDLSSSDDTKKDIKLKDLSKLLQNVDFNFMNLDSPEDDASIIIQDESDEENSKLKKERPKLNLNKSLPTELKELSFKFNDLSRKIKELKKYAEKLEVELPGDLKEIPNKVEKFTTIVFSLTTQVDELKTLQRELPAKFLSIPGQVSSIQAKIKTLDSLPSLLYKVTEALDIFIQAVEHASIKASDQGVPSVGQVGTHPVEGEKNTEQATITQLFKQRAKKMLKGKHGELIKKDKGKKAMSSKDAKEEGTDSESDDTIKITGSMVESSKQKKLKKFDFVTKKGEHQEEGMKEEWIDLLDVDVVKKKGPITLKVYREDRSDKVITDFKASDLYLSRWREVMKACPNRKGAGWSTIYGQIKTRMDYLYKTEAKLGIDLEKPLQEQDALDRLNELARKKRKHADDIYNLFRSTKKYKSSV
nr:hypothetical protein [Tanacetum cinerariifolium]